MWGHPCAKRLVDLQTPPVVRLQSCAAQAQRARGGDAPGREEHDVGREAFARLEANDRPPGRPVRDLDRLDRLAQAKRHVAMPHLVDELLDNLAVQELERPLPLLDERDGNAQRREHRGVLDSDNTAAHYGHGPGNLLEVDHVVARDDDLAVGGDAGRGRRLRPHGDHDVLGRDSPPAVALAHLKGVRVGERGLPPDDRHVVAAQLGFDDVLLAGEDLADLGEELYGRRTSVGLRRARSVGPRREAVEEQNRLAKGLARNGPGAQADAAETGVLLDHCGGLAELRRLDGGPLAGGPAADAHEVVVVRPRHLRLPRCCCSLPDSRRPL